MGNKKIGLGLMLNLIGAMFAYLIGSGFASGQETMQYFSGWGSVWASLGVAAIALLLSCLAYIAYSYAGRTRGLQDLAGIYDFYAGNVFGKLFQVFAWLFNACCYMFMISGFGNVIHQQWGISIPIGSAIGVVLSVTIAVMGLNKIIDIIGKVGPIIVLFTLFIGIVAAFRYYPMIAEGNAAINSGDVDVIRAGSNWVTAGLSFAGCNLLLVSAFVGTIGYNLREYKFIYNQLIMIISSGGIMLVSFLMGLNHIGNIQAAVQASIPNLLLANNVFGGNAGIILSLLFAIIILAAIFSTICPMFCQRIINTRLCRLGGREIQSSVLCRPPFIFTISHPIRTGSFKKVLHNEKPSVMYCNLNNFNLYYRLYYCFSSESISVIFSSKKSFSNKVIGCCFSALSQSAGSSFFRIFFSIVPRTLRIFRSL